MFNQQTINKLYELKLTGMAEAFAENSISRTWTDSPLPSVSDSSWIASGPGRKTTGWNATLKTPG